MFVETKTFFYFILKGCQIVFFVVNVIAARGEIFIFFKEQCFVSQHVKEPSFLSSGIYCRASLRR